MISECEETPAVHANKDGEKKNRNDVEREEREVEEIAAILQKLF